MKTITHKLNPLLIMRIIRAGEQIIGKFGSDITGVDRVTQEITPFPEQEQLLVGTEVWNFGR